MAKPDQSSPITCLLSLIVGAVVWFAVCNRPGSSASGSTQSSADPPLNQKMAVIDGNDRDPDKVARYDHLLDLLSAAYSETRIHIADVTAKTQDELKERGIGVSELEILEGMNTIEPKRTQDAYAGYLAMFVFLRDKGESSTQAFLNLRSYDPDASKP